MFVEQLAYAVDRQLLNPRTNSMRQTYAGRGSGRVFFVMATSKTNYTQFAEDHPDYKSADGVVTAAAVYNTIATAVAACTASQNDVIYVTEGYTETITSGALNLAGMQIVGLGKGSLRPTFTFAAAASKFTVSANNVAISNCIFVANFADVVTIFLVTGASEFQCVGNEFRDTDSTHNMLTCVTTVVSTTCDGLVFSGNRIAMLGTTALTTPVKVACTMDRIQINDNYVTKAAVNNTSCLLAHGALVVTNLEMARNIIFSKNTDSSSGGFLITTSATTCTGMVYNNYVKGLDVAAAIMVYATGSKYGEFNNLYTGDVDTSGFVLPAIGSDS